MKKHHRSLFIAFVLAMAFFSGNLWAQSQIGFNGIGGKLGLVDPENINSVIGFGAFADLGTIAPNIFLEGNLDFWSKSISGFGAKSSFRDIALSGTVKYAFKTSNQALRPFVAGGLGFHIVRAKVDLGGLFGSSSKTETKIGIDLGGGAFYAFNEQMDFLAELKYRLVSDMNQLAIQVGILYHLLK